MALPSGQWAMFNSLGNVDNDMSNGTVQWPGTKSLCRLQFVHFGFQISGLCFVRFEDLRWNSDKGF